MGVIRYDLEKCVGCGKCMNICPMDVFRFNAAMKKSVIEYPESCISCGQCFYYCPAGSLAVDNYAYGYNLNAFRGVPEGGMDRTILTPR